MPSLTDLRNISHSALAILGILSAVLGAVQMALSQYDPSISTAIAPQLLIIGGILVAVSKAIDSLNAALLGILPSAPPVVVTPPKP